MLGLFRREQNSQSIPFQLINILWLLHYFKKYSDVNDTLFSVCSLQLSFDYCSMMCVLFSTYIFFTFILWDFLVGSFGWTLFFYPNEQSIVFNWNNYIYIHILCGYWYVHHSLPSSCFFFFSSFLICSFLILFSTYFVLTEHI